jgi:3-oxoacyl-(acyl-carrier-protein) synthase
MASMLNAAPAQISIRHQILGPVMTHGSACTSSGSAIGDAARAIRHGISMSPWPAARRRR